MAQWPQTLPLLLAGPVVRRVEPGEPGLAAVWVAVRAECTVRLSVWEGFVDVGTGEGTAAPDEAPLAEETRSTRRLGTRLHTAVVTVRTERLRPDAVFSYNVTLEGDGDPQDLRSLGLLTEENGRTPLGYAPGDLPTFVLPPPEVTDLTLVQASCRLIDDPNDTGPDALPWLDDRIRRERAEPRHRPHQLYLTGDQIYADHVAPAVLSMLTPLGNHLIGAVELLPIAGGEWPADLRHAPAGWRQHPATSEAGLTATASDSHLFSLGEYCAMYLAAWSPDVWPSPTAWPPGGDPDEEPEGGDPASALRRLPGQEEPGDGRQDGWGTDDAATRALWASLLGVDSDTVAQLAEVGDPCAADADLDALPEEARTQVRAACDQRAELTAGVEAQEQLVTRFHAGLPAVRRALANVPTYMVFDDHDVTDDWNVTYRWAQRVSEAPLGRRVLRNGLLAYAACQAEGNDPERFAADGSPEAGLLAHASALFPASDDDPDRGDDSGAVRAPAEPAAAEIDDLLGLGQDVPPQVRWHYQVPGPRHRTVVLDTRTRRRFAGEVTPAALISPEQLDRQIPEGPLAAGEEVLVVVSAAPVLGLPLIETFAGTAGAAAATFLYRMGWGASQPGWLFPDREAWSQEPVAFETLLRRLAPYRRILFLSGDVHYAMGAALSYWRTDAVPGDGPGSARFVQFTSSGACNAWPPVVAGIARSFALAQDLLTATAPVAQLGWHEARPRPVTVPDETFLTPALRARLDRAPVVLPTHGWPDGTEMARDPDWSWRLEILADRRPVDALPEAARPQALDGDIVPEDGIAAYHAVARRHADALTAVTHSRRTQWWHNIGIVRFQEDSDGHLTARHDVLSRHPHARPAEAPDVYTSHRADLDATGEEPPALTGGAA